MTFTKERLQKLIRAIDCENYDEEEIVAWVNSDEIMELARIALASLTAEPVAYIDPFSLQNFATYRTGETDNKRMGREWMWADSDAGLVPVYAAPPAPVVPETLPCPVMLEPGLRFGKGVRTQTMLDALQRRAEYSAELEAMTPSQRAEHDAGIKGFAAMLQGAEPVKVDLTLREGLAAIRNSGIAIDAGKIQAERDALNSPAIPDDVRRMEWLVSKTVDVREPMVYGSHSLFWSQTITDEEDDYHATKLREQIDAAMAAENAAAPQRKVI